MWRCFLDSLELAHELVDTVLDKKGSDILLLDIREQSIFADYFLICNGDNERQLQALADNIAQDAKKKGGVAVQGIEGNPSGGWILIDLGPLVVHVFSPSRRHYYQLEDIWSQSHIVMRVQ